MIYGLLGKSISYSFSPQIHKVLGSYPYELIEKDEDEIEYFFRDKNFKAINVTIPYKKLAMDYCDILDPVAEKIGNVNTIVNREGNLYGYNTDYYGFIYTLEKMGIDIRDKKCLIVGDGATSKTVRICLEDMGAENIKTVSRKGQHKFEDLSYYEDSDILINCTPIGNALNLDVQFPIDLKSMTDLAFLIDLNYNPLKTNIMLQAEKLGCQVSSGLTMLVGQAIKASELFQDKEIDSGKEEGITEEIINLINNKK